MSIPMKRTKSDFLTRPILPALLKFSIPVLLALLLQALYGAVDLWAVGKFGTTADVPVVATGSQAMQIIIGLITGLSMGSTVLLGTYVGRKDHDGAAKAIGSSLWVFGVLGVALTVITVLAAPWIARVTNAPAEAFSQTVSYIRICGAGSLFVVAYNLISAIFRGLGDARSPLYFVMIACVTNILGDITLTKFIPLGASGAAIATVAAQAVSVVLSLVLVRKKGLPFAVEKAHLRFDKENSGSILKSGAPIALQSMCNEVSCLILIGFVNALGEVASAGVGIAEKLVMFILLIPHFLYAVHLCVCGAKRRRGTAGTCEKGDVAGNGDRRCLRRYSGLLLLLPRSSAFYPLYQGRRNGGAACFGGVFKSDQHRVLHPFRRLLLYRLFQWRGENNICYGAGAFVHLPCEAPVCVVCQYTA